MKILITGANRGLGLVACESFIKDGWEVIPFTRKELDFTTINPAWMMNLPEDIEAIIHCAGGGLGYRGPYLTSGQFYELFQVNVGGAAEINRRFLPRMQAEGYGRVVHVCSIASGEAVGSVGYNTVKAALGAYVRSLGRELARYGVVVSGISPGGFQAPGGAMARLQEANPQAYQEFIEKRLPRGRMGEADELIPLLRYLVSKEASMMGGSLISIDAGEGIAYNLS